MMTLWMLLLGCEGPTSPPDGLLNPSVSCALSLSQDRLDFGAHTLSGLTQPVLRSLTLSNVGETPCASVLATLESQSRPVFSMQTQSLDLEPGQSVELELGYLPQDWGEDTAQLHIVSQDQSQPALYAEVLGLGLAPEIGVIGGGLDFGSLPVGCAQSQDLSVVNLGNAALQISALAFDSETAELSLEPPQEGPWRLAAGESLELSIGHTPLDPGLELVTLQITSDDPNTPELGVQILAEGSSEGWVVDTFEQPSRPKSDVLFAFDWSGAFSAHRAVADNLAAFVGELEDADVDYRISAVVSDDGCHLGETLYVDEAMSALEQLVVFEALACVDQGGSSCPFAGAQQERAFTMMEGFLSATNQGAGGCNEAFLRDEAQLHLISISDEPEQSSAPWPHYLAHFQGLKAEPNDVVFHAIGGDYPKGCGNHAHYSGFYEATVASGGLFLSLCSADYEAYMTDLGQAVAPRLDRFTLSQVPAAQTLQVRVDGELVEQGWTLDSTDNVLVFEAEHAPALEATLQVSYGTAAACQ